MPDELGIMISKGCLTDLMSAQKHKIMRIINEEINLFREEASLNLKEGKIKDAKIKFKTIQRLENMIRRIQLEA